MNTRHLDIPLEVKAISGNTFSGYGAVFDNVDLGGDIIEFGAFTKTLADYKRKESMPLMFWAHKSDQVPGVWQEVKEDGQGLFVKGELVDTQLGRELKTLLQKKAVRGLSIGYKVRDADFTDNGNRLIKELDLFEISIVSMNMNPLANVEQMKSRLSEHGEYVPSPREFEQILRKAGCSSRVSKQIVSIIKHSDEFREESYSSKDLKQSMDNLIQKIQAGKA